MLFPPHSQPVRIDVITLFLACSFLIQTSSKEDAVATPRSIPKLPSKRFVPAHYHSYDSVNDDNNNRMSIENMTCSFFTQPLDHFAPRGKSPTFQQRYCVYDGYAADTTKTGQTPILFYTGNESPLEQYINHTGLMWELAPQLQARVVFVEHRYEGLSVPKLSDNCMAYASTLQALADYADILQLHLNPPQQNQPQNASAFSTTSTTASIAPVIAFGGSYGGMLAAWMRMKYPHLIAGAIAASAPIAAFPQQANYNMDGATQVLAHGIQQSYPPDKKKNDNAGEGLTNSTNHCLTNLLAAWPLITWLVQESSHHQQGHDDDDDDDNPSTRSMSSIDPGTFLQDVFHLCDPYTSTDPEPLVCTASLSHCIGCSVSTDT